MRRKGDTERIQSVGRRYPGVDQKGTEEESGLGLVEVV